MLLCLQQLGPEEFCFVFFLSKSKNKQQHIFRSSCCDVSGQKESGIMTIITFCFTEERLQKHICPLFNGMNLVTDARIGFFESFLDITDVWTNLGENI